MDAKKGNLHTSNDPSRGYVEYDPYIKLSDGKKVKGQHGIMDIPSEVARSAYDKGMLNNPIIKDIIKK